MDSITVVKDQLLRHFSHEHPLSLVYLQQLNNKNQNSDDEDENGEQDDSVEEVLHGGQCSMCKEQIWSFHLCYYFCKSCDYSLHTFCVELPETLQNCPSHPSHTLRLGDYYYGSKCFVCKLTCDNYYYRCDDCSYSIDPICATVSEQKIKHPSHPHQLERMFGHITSICVACGNKHEGVFFQCTSCPMFRINMGCALLPTKLLIQTSTNGIFRHSHPLNLTFSLPYDELKANYNPNCRICNKDFCCNLWNYKCVKCRYYVHVHCATSKREPLGQNYREDEHPNLLHCPFQDEGDNLLKRHMSNQTNKQHDGERLNHSCHQHPLILFDKKISADKKLVSLHDPMKRVQLLCDGCVKPIVTVPFYMCCKYADEQCSFVLHEWCANLPSQIQHYLNHPQHPLVLSTKIPTKFFGMFTCCICYLPSNGFAYKCTKCGYCVDINYAFIPKEITHEAHPDHLLSLIQPISNSLCKACFRSLYWSWAFGCSSCDFYIHMSCALLLPRVIKHKLDKHSLSLRYEPAENHIGDYFCELCEDEFNPWKWFYHCTTCAQSMHTNCAPLILQSQCEQATSGHYETGVYEFLNIKFGGKIEIKDHPHPLSFVQGIQSNGKCSNCSRCLEGNLIFKCVECEFAIDHECASLLFVS